MMSKAVRMIGVAAAGLLILAGCSMFHRNESASRTGSSGSGSAGTSSYSQGSSGMSGSSSTFRSGQTASSDSVKKAQEQLKTAGFDPGQIDGTLGPDTQKALKDFQQSKGLPATGQLDRQTQQALASAGGSMGSSGSSAAGTSGSSGMSGSSSSSGAGTSTSNPNNTSNTTNKP
jgi:peptidoglycan hydrolase-like protein with peptidoglycan-binding domain